MVLVAGKRRGPLPSSIPLPLPNFLSKAAHSTMKISPKTTAKLVGLAVLNRRGQILG